MKCCRVFFCSATVEEQRYGEMVPLAYYDVKYVLGGSEKKILETYIQCVGREGKTARPACPRDLFTVEASEVRETVYV